MASYGGQPSMLLSPFHASPSNLDLSKPACLAQTFNLNKLNAPSIPFKPIYSQKPSRTSQPPSRTHVTLTVARKHSTLSHSLTTQHTIYPTHRNKRPNAARNNNRMRTLDDGGIT